MKKNVTVIGVCGLPCSGKSFLFSNLTRGDFLVIDCDKMAKSILCDNKKKVESLIGVSDPAAVASVIFSNKKMYDAYTDFIWKRLQRVLRNIIKDRKFSTIILDAPLLLESGLTSLCDTIVVLKTKDSLRRKRASSRGWSKKALSERDSFFTKTFRVLNQIPI